MDKIDTQGMGAEGVESSSVTRPNIYEHDENGNPIYPRMRVRPERLFTSLYVKEMKILINEVLDEREYKRKVRMAYDDPTPPGVSYFDTKHFEHFVGDEEPSYPLEKDV